MKRILITMCCVVFLCSISLSQVTRAEYFIDSDPGCGLGENIDFATSESIDVDFDLPTNISPGMHWLYIRVQGPNLIWSPWRRTPIFVIDAESQNILTQIVAAEYFFDTDPGTGNGNPFAIDAGEPIDVSEVINQNLDPGIHFLYVRAKGQNGIWSSSQRIPVYVQTANNGFEIESAEYYFDTDPGYGSGTPIDITPGYSLNETFDFANPFNSGSHTINVRVKSASGIWSNIVSESFSYCESYGPTASFNYTLNQGQAIFQNTSINQTSSVWEFGDGTPQFGALSPAHVYGEPGIYNACLYTSNGCGTASACSTLVVSGLQNLTPTQGQPNGIFYLTATGTGLANGDALKLRYSDGTELTPEYTSLIPGNKLRSRFTFNNASLGLYDLILISPNGNDTLVDAYNIGVPSYGGLAFSISGRDQVRTNRATVQMLNITNPSSETMLLTPVLVAFPGDLNVVIPSSFYNDPLVPQEYQNYSPNHIYPYTDPEGNVTKYALIGVPNIPPGGSVNIPLVVNSGDVGCHEIYYSEWVQKYPDGPPDVSCTFLSGGAQCALSLLSLVPIVSCGTSTFNLTCTVQNMIGSGEAGVLDLMSNFGGAVADCVAGLVPEAAFVQVLEKLDQITDISSAASLCSDYMLNWELETGYKTVCFSNSFDPNVKNGVQGQTPENYVNNREPLSYVISAENLETATAPAATVIIRDTLNAAYFDFNTVRMESLQIADTIFYFQGDATEMVRDIYWPVNGEDAVVRYSYEFNATNGVMTHQFETLMMSDYALPEDPAYGFLMPNIDSPEGELSVHFTVKPLESLQHLDDIYNQASIYFDTNEAITTNAFHNVVDIIPPVSTILPIAATQTENEIVLHFSGSDEHALLKDYALQVSVNNGPYEYIATAIQVDSMVITGELGNTYRFKIRARDYADNVEAEHTFPDAEITIVSTVLELEYSTLALYPNPSSDKVFIELPRIAPLSELTLTDAIGNLVMLKSENMNRLLELDVKGLPAGLYFVRYQVDNRTYVGRIMRE